jgi:hypothetical protein
MNNVLNNPTVNTADIDDHAESWMSATDPMYVRLDLARKEIADLKEAMAKTKALEQPAWCIEGPASRAITLCSFDVRSIANALAVNYDENRSEFKVRKMWISINSFAESAEPI